MTVTATNQHYDLDPEVFAQFLDPSRKYSSALYLDGAETLEAAQRRKLRFVAEQLRLGPEAGLLDVGCGWGSLLLYAAAEYRCAATGISPAPRQREYIAAQAARRGLPVRTVAGRFDQVTLPDRSFAAVSMLGSIIHMPDLADAFARARRLLRRDGRLYVSESCFRNAAVHAEFEAREGTRFVRDRIFGWGDLRPLSELVRGAEDAGLSVDAVHDLTDHYRRTIDDWLTNLDTSRDGIDAVRPGLADELERYLLTANAGWGYTTKHYALTCRRTR